MSYPATQLGGGAFNHQSSSNAEAEYDRLRDLARQEAGKRSSCMAKSQQAYQRGDGASAHSFSEEGKRHGAMMDTYNHQASEYIFRENNSLDRVAADTIDLHGQFVEEAEDIVEQRIRYAQSTGQTHLHVIVGKGNHSPGHVQKIKPRVEQVCRELGLSYATEENAGRIFSHHGGGYHPGYGGRPYQGGQQQQQQQQQYQQYGQQQQGGPYPNQQPHNQQQQYGGGGGQQHNQNQNEEIKKQVKKYLPKVIRLIRQNCCTIM
ncbi:MAG: hypothetical protein OHK93_007861 [Ramalina farinacea]|uniref:Smr domain-containing protein n=1 Tax=Ramalina farinacea TaxID=258253 RepID=A0AA43QLB2_9LECA|nr:hypothetical protein [Ramalina farinacea]